MAVTVLRHVLRHRARLGVLAAHLASGRLVSKRRELAHLGRVLRALTRLASVGRRLAVDTRLLLGLTLALIVGFARILLFLLAGLPLLADLLEFCRDHESAVVRFR